MKCLFDLSYIRYNPYAGVSKYAYRILDYIVKAKKTSEYTLLLNDISEKQIREWYPQFDYIVIGSGCLKKIPMARTLALSYKFKKVANHFDGDIIFCPWGNEITCLKVNKKKVSVIHDLQTRIDLKGWLLWIHKQIDDLVIKNSTRIVTISEFSRKQILSFYPLLSDDNLISLGNSVSSTNYTGERPIAEKYILYVGRVCKMKNVITLVKAFANIHRTIEDYKLVIVGKKNEYWQNEIQPILESQKIANKVLVVEDCSDKELVMWYRHTSLFVFPSLREGFGFPPLEAAIECVPVLSTTCDSLKEVLMDKVYTYNQPCDDNELGYQIVTILKNPPSAQELNDVKSIYLQNYSIDVVGKRIDDYLHINTEK